MNLFFIIPVKDERETLRDLTEGILENSQSHASRILFVDDGSTDGSGEALDGLASDFEGVEVVHFDVNRGKTAALAEGFDRAEGDVVFTMDSDLQDDPVEIPAFLEALEQGYDLVCGWKAVRNDPWHKRLLSRVYNGFVAGLFGVKLHDINCGYKAMTLEVAQSLELKHDYHRLIPVLAAKAGFHVGEIKVQHHARIYGHSKYGLARLWHGLRDTLRVWLDR